MSKPGFFAEIKRRNVLRVGAFYAGTAWLLTEVCTQVLPLFEVPPSVLRIVIIALVTGFVPSLLFAWFFELTPQGLKLQRNVAPETSITRQTGRALDRWIIVVLAISVLVLLTTIVLDRLPTQAGPATAMVDGGPKSIAVLPLANSTGDPANEYFADGMSEELISTLSRVTGLKVIGRTSSFQFKGKSEASTTIGEKLGVGYLLEGSVRKSSDRVRIAVALIKAVDGSNLWSDSYDRELKDIFSLQTEIASAVVGHLKLALLGGGSEQPLAAPTAAVTANLAAYNALLQGNFYVQRNTREDTLKAIDYYRQAVRLDPGYALGWARLSDAVSSASIFFAVTRLPDGSAAEALARTASDKALQLGPRLSESYLAHGVFQDSFEMNLRAAEDSFRRGLQLEPQNVDLMRRLANLLGNIGRYGEASELLRRALVLDPLRSASHYNLGLLLASTGDLDGGEAALRKALDVQPGTAQAYCYLAIVEVLRQRPQQALALAQKEPDPIWRAYAVAMALSAGSDRAAADAALAKLIKDYGDVALVQAAIVYAQRGEREKMYEWLERAIAAKDAGMSQIMWEPSFRPYRDEPRFLEYARRFGLVPPAAGG